MSIKEKLRPVKVTLNGEQIEGYFHRFVYKVSDFQSETHVLVELKDGRLRYFDPYFVQFSDREQAN